MVHTNQVHDTFNEVEKDIALAILYECQMFRPDPDVFLRQYQL